MSVTSDLLGDPSTPDERIAELAASASAADVERIVADEARLVRHPGIVAALFANPAAPMAVVNRAVTACARAGVQVEAIPGFVQVAESVAADPEALTLAASRAFDIALEQAEAPATSSPAPAAPAAPAAPTPVARRGAAVDPSKLKLHEKIRLATLGNASARATLLRDANKMVALAAIRSPRITEKEIVEAAASRSVCEEVLRYIAGRREHLKLYPVKVNLVRNPKCPLALAMKLLPQLMSDDIKEIARSKNVATALATQAKRLVAGPASRA